MLTDEERRRSAQALLQAERERKVIPQLSRTFPNIELVDAYAIQGLASRFIPKIEGSYTNVVGLPVATVVEMLNAMGAARL